MPTWIPMFRLAALGLISVLLLIDSGCAGKVIGESYVATPALSATSLNFSSVTVGDASAEQVLTLSNHDIGDLSIQSAGVSDAANFQFENRCGSVLSSGASCSVRVRFTPTISEPLKATLTIVFGSGRSAPATQTVALSGIGVTPPKPLAQLGTSLLAFADTLISTSSPVLVATLQNIGNAPLHLSRESLNDSRDYSISASACPAELTPGSSCALSVQFTPQSAGAIAGTLTFTDDSGGVADQVQTITLAGMSVAPNAQVTPNSLTFQTSTGLSKGTATLTNTGSAPLQIKEVGVTGSGSSLFQIDRDSCTGILQPSESCLVEVTLDGTIDGPEAQAYLTFTDNALEAQNATQSVALTGLPTRRSVAITENFGDSITCGYGVQWEQDYAYLFDSFIGAPSRNLCREGDAAADLARIQVPFNSTPDALSGQLSTVMIGTNDADRFNAAAWSLQSFTDEVGASLAWLAIPNEDKVLGQAALQSNGEWSKDGDFGVSSVDPGASLTWQVPPATVSRNYYVVYHVWAAPLGQAGRAEISVDGVVQVTVDESQGGTLDIPTGNGTYDTYRLAVVPLGNTSPHTLQFRSVGPAGSRVGLLWAGAPTRDYHAVSTAPRVLVGLVLNSPLTRQTAAAAQYNLQLGKLVPSLNADGMDITVVPTDHVLDPALDFFDNYHPNQSGYAKLTSIFERYAQQ